MKRIEITDPTLTRIVDAIERTLHPKRIYLFGSRADGSARDDSDYDLLIIYDGPLRKYDAMVAVAQAIDKHDFAMDLIILRSEEFEWQKDIATTIANEVEATGMSIYG